MQQLLTQPHLSALRTSCWRCVALTGTEEEQRDVLVRTVRDGACLNQQWPERPRLVAGEVQEQSTEHVVRDQNVSAQSKDPSASTGGWMVLLLRSLLRIPLLHDLQRCFVASSIHPLGWAPFLPSFLRAARLSGQW